MAQDRSADAVAATPSSDEQRRRRKPSTGFPVIDLGEVQGVLTKASQHGWEHTVAEFAGYMGHATVNSGAFRAKLAALRDYGVISGRGDALEMTTIGRRIAVPETSEDRVAALREAFANTVFGPLYEESVKGSPISVDSIGRRAVNRLGVAPASQGPFGDVFARSVVAADLGESIGDGRITLKAKVQTGAEGSGHEATSIATTSEVAGPPRVLSNRKPIIDQRWHVDDQGEVTLTIALDRPLAASDFAAVGAVVNEIERLVVGLKLGNASA